MLTKVRPSLIYDPLVCTQQRGETWCGPAVVQSILAKHGKYLQQYEIADELGTDETGTKFESIYEMLRRRGISPSPPADHSLETVLSHVRCGGSAILAIRAYGDSHLVALIGESRSNYILCDPFAETGVGVIKKWKWKDHWINRTSVLVPAPKKQHKWIPVQEVPL